MGSAAVLRPAHVWIKQDKFRESFCQDLAPDEALVMAVTQEGAPLVPPSGTLSRPGVEEKADLVPGLDKRPHDPSRAQPVEDSNGSVCFRSSIKSSNGAPGRKCPGWLIDSSQPSRRKLEKSSLQSAPGRASTVWTFFKRFRRTSHGTSLYAAL